MTSRPTAVNLREALTRINNVTAQNKHLAPQDLAAKVSAVAKQVCQYALVHCLVDETNVLRAVTGSEDVDRNYLIGDKGAEWLLAKLEAEGAIEKGASINVLTVSTSSVCPCRYHELNVRDKQVCNTGSLATSGYGTALVRSPSRADNSILIKSQGLMTSLHLLGRLEHAFFAQTAPYQQGARLTSLELQSLNM